MSMELPVSSCRLPAPRRIRRAFSFTEILFAVIILGIGFIMVAGMFPVALQQAKTTSEETAGTSLARAAAAQLAQILSDSADPAGATAMLRSNAIPTADVVSGDDAKRPPVRFYSAPASGKQIWDNIRGGIIQSDDPRLAWTVLYRREGNPVDPYAAQGNWAPYAQIFIFCMQSRIQDVFTPADAGPAVAPTPNLVPRLVSVAIENDVITAGGADLIDIQGPEADAAIEGAYIVIADDKLANPNRGIMNGRIYKLGLRRNDLDGNATIFGMTANRVYELLLGSDFSPDPGNDTILGTADDITAVGHGSPVVAYIIGRGKNGASYEGTSMAINAYMTYVRVKP